MATEQPQQQQQSDLKKVGSDGEDFSDTANETGTFEVRRECVFLKSSLNIENIVIFLQVVDYCGIVDSRQFGWHMAK